MTDDKYREDLSNKTIGQLMLRVLKLTGMLIYACMVYAMRCIIKGLAWCTMKCIDGFNSLVEFWNSSDTQEKKKRIIAATKRGLKAFAEMCLKAWKWTKAHTIIGAKFAWKYTVIGSKLFVKYFVLSCIGIWKGTIWTIKTLKDLIVNSKPTFIRLGKDIKNGVIAFWKWLIRVCRATKLGYLRRKRAWQHFRRTKGFKSLLVDMGKSMSNGVKSFMEEEQNETNPEAITEDDIIAEEIEERQGKANSLGKKIFKGVKDIVEENNDN